MVPQQSVSPKAEEGKHALVSGCVWGQGATLEGVRFALPGETEQLFGVGLVKTSEDFGAQGEWPSHPDLLDYLAVTFVESGWDVKAMHKLIVMSATYRQTAAAEAAMLDEAERTKTQMRATLEADARLPILEGGAS